MASIFATQDMLIKIDEAYHPVVVSVDQPIDGGDGFFYSHVRFPALRNLTPKLEVLAA